jgi:acyl-coenzyme A synthetase/AMP-(fatty) acid ligase
MKGRKDRVIKIAEKRISLTEIEKFLEAQSTISHCVALPIYAKRDVIGCAVVLSDEGKKLASHSGEGMLITRWKAAMQSRFEAVTIPRQWRILAEIPVNSQSKIDQRQLLAEFTGNQDPS